MFGYLQIKKSEMLVKEYETYKSIYCSLCKTLGREYSVFSRLLLSYDSTFFAVLLMALNAEGCSFKKGRCVCNPLKTCNYCTGEENALKSAAAFSVIGAYYKLLDEICDSTPFKSFWLKLIKPFFSRQRKKALKNGFAAYDKILNQLSYSQRAVESKPDPILDECCEPTAEMLGELFKTLSQSNNEQKALYHMGYHIGRWVYIADAADDVEKDVKGRQFNPFSLSYKDPSFKDECNALMNMAVSEVYSAFELLTIKTFYGILNNLFVYGMPQIQKNILYLKDKEGKAKNEKSL